jgi:hypothetical protein
MRACELVCEHAPQGVNELKAALARDGVLRSEISTNDLLALHNASFDPAPRGSELLVKNRVRLSRVLGHLPPVYHRWNNRGWGVTYRALVRVTG